MPEETRRARVADLEGMPLREPSLVEARDICITAHRGLLEAEDEQADARRSLDTAAKRHPGGGIPADEAELIAAAIERSNVALARAQEALPRCEQESRQLALRAR